MNDDKQVLLATQKESSEDDPHIDSIYDVATIATVLQLLKLPDGTVKVLVEGGQRAHIDKYIEETPSKARATCLMMKKTQMKKNAMP